MAIVPLASESSQEISPFQDPDAQVAVIVAPSLAIKLTVPSSVPTTKASTMSSPSAKIDTDAPFHPSPNESKPVNVNAIGRPVASASKGILAEPLQKANNVSALGGPGTTVAGVEITTSTAALCKSAPSSTTTEYVPAAKSVGAGPNAPPSTEKLNGGVPHSTVVIANVPSALPIQETSCASIPTFTSVTSTTTSTAALSVQFRPVDVTKKLYVPVDAVGITDVPTASKGDPSPNKVPPAASYQFKVYVSEGVV